MILRGTWRDECTILGEAATVLAQRNVFWEVQIPSPRLFFKRSPLARTSKGFLIVGLTVTAGKSCSNSAASWSDVPDQLTQPLSSLHDGRFKSRRPLQRQITEPLHGKPTI